MTSLKYIAAFLIGLLVALMLTPRSEVTNGYPRKPITLVVAYSPGGAVDNIARTVGQHIEAYLGQRVVVQNKPGAGGEIGYRSLALAANDGYTLGMITAPPILMLGMLREDSSTDIKDYEAIASLQRDPVLIAVNGDSEYRTLDDLLEAAAQAADLLNIAGDGPNSNNQLQLAVAEELLSTDFNFVPFDGSGPSITALLGNQVDAAVPSASSATDYVRRGELRALAVFSPQRYAYLPDVPTIFEASGVDVPDIGAAVRGVVIPAGVPQERKAVLMSAFSSLIDDDAFLEHAASVQLPLHYMDADDFAHYLADSRGLLEEYLGLLKEKAK